MTNPYEPPQTSKCQKARRRWNVLLAVVPAVAMYAWCIPNATEYTRLSAIANPAHPQHRRIVPTEFGEQVGIAVAKAAIGTVLTIAALRAGTTGV